MIFPFSLLLLSTHFNFFFSFCYFAILLACTVGGIMWIKNEYDSLSKIKKKWERSKERKPVRSICMHSSIFAMNTWECLWDFIFSLSHMSNRIESSLELQMRWNTFHFSLSRKQSHCVYELWCNEYNFFFFSLFFHIIIVKIQKKSMNIVAPVTRHNVHARVCAQGPFFSSFSNTKSYINITSHITDFDNNKKQFCEYFSFFNSEIFLFRIFFLFCCKIYYRNSIFIFFLIKICLSAFISLIYVCMKFSFFLNVDLYHGEKKFLTVGGKRKILFNFNLNKKKYATIWMNVTFY